MFRRSRVPVAIAVMFAAMVTPAAAEAFGMCNIPIPTPAAPSVGNPNVNVTIVTCGVDEFEIVQASLSGGSPVSIGPVQGIDSIATATALDEAAPLLGLLPSELQVSGLSEITQSGEFVEEIYAVSSNAPAVLGVDYIGDPNDYQTWIAIGPVDVEVLVSQATVTTYGYQLDLVENSQPVPVLPGVLLAALVGLVGLSGVRALRR